MAGATRISFCGLCILEVVFSLHLFAQPKIVTPVVVGIFQDLLYGADLSALNKGDRDCEVRAQIHPPPSFPILIDGQDQGNQHTFTLPPQGSWILALTTQAQSFFAGGGTFFFERGCSALVHVQAVYGIQSDGKTTELFSVDSSAALPPGSRTVTPVVNNDALKAGVAFLNLPGNATVDILATTRDAGGSQIRQTQFPSPEGYGQLLLEETFRNGDKGATGPAGVHPDFEGTLELCVVDVPGGSQNEAVVAKVLEIDLQSGQLQDSSGTTRGAACTVDATTLCLTGEVQIQVDYRPGIETELQQALAFSQTNRSGYFQLRDDLALQVALLDTAETPIGSTILAVGPGPEDPLEDESILLSVTGSSDTFFKPILERRVLGQIRFSW